MISTRKIAGMALGMLVAFGAPEPPAEAATKKCSTLERRLDGRLRRGLKACARSGGVLTVLRCAGDKREQHVSALSTQGCSSPAWAVDIDTSRVDAETVALVWTSRLNWARLLVRRDDPIASSVRLPNERFQNLLLIDPSGDVAAVLDYVADIEARAEDIDDGLPGALRGGGRPSFPSITDRSAIEALEVLLRVADACVEGGEPSMFAAERGFRLGGVSGDTFKDAQDPNSAGDNGNAGIFAAEVFSAIVNAIIDKVTDDEPEPDDGQCVEDTDGQCTDDPDDDQTSATTSSTVPPTSTTVPPPPSGNPTSDPGPDGESCPLTVEAMTAICESVDWQTPTCRAMVRGVNACADESVIKPAPDGDAPCSGEGMSREELQKLECERRGGIAQPAPDGELVCVVHDPAQTPPDLGIDPCNSPETQGTPECAEQGGVGIGVDPLPPTPRPDPRLGTLRPRF
jgi:hypothetical protein